MPLAVLAGKREDLVPTEALTLQIALSVGSLV